MKSIFAILLLVLLTGNSWASQCPCQPAQPHDQPHGANSAIQIDGKAVKQIRGRVSDPSGDPMAEAVVEVYEYAGSDSKLSPRELVDSKKRRMACFTDKGGNFCFPDLPSGKYVIHVGTRYSAGFQEIFMSVTLRRHWWNGWRRASKVEVLLPVGW